FNKSHSAAYAVITYQTAYLKCFYPVEFMAALLTTEVSSTENVVKYIQESRSHGIEVLPPDVNVSEISFSVDYNVDDALKNRRKHKLTTYGRIRFGLSAVKGMGDQALEAILEVRNRVGRFNGFYHFLEELPAGKVNRKVLEVMIKSGALDTFGRSRSTLFASIDDALSIADANRQDANSAQFSLFGGGASTKRAEKWHDVAEWSAKEKLANERESVGFYLSGHPLDRYVDDAKKLGAVPTVELTTLKHNSEVVVAGIVASMKERKLKTSDGRWAVVTLEDTFGQAEVLCFSKVYEAGEVLLKAGEPVLIKGKVLIDDVDDDGKQLMPKMRAEAVESLAEAQIARTRWLDITVDAGRKPGTVMPLVPTMDDDVANDAVGKTLEHIVAALGTSPGVVPARLRLEMPAGYSVLVQSGNDVKVTPTEDLVASIERIKGVLGVARN
ncbi:MAG TPA: hypothetical protein VGF99_17500, partial [Myxococcota bacterium]